MFLRLVDDLRLGGVCDVFASALRRTLINGISSIYILQPEVAVLSIIGRGAMQGASYFFFFQIIVCLCLCIARHYVGPSSVLYVHTNASVFYRYFSKYYVLNDFIIFKKKKKKIN